MRRAMPGAVFLIGASLGLLAEGLLVLWAHTSALEAWLKDDLRVLVFMKDGVSAARRAVAEEKVRALPGVGSLRLVLSEESLGEFASGDPDLARSAAFLGVSPLPDALEVRLSDEGLRGLSGWLKQAEDIDEVGDIVYKPLEVQSVLQIQLYRRLLTLALAFALSLWLFALALRLWARAASGASAAPGAAASALASGLGTAAGMGLLLLLLLPVHRSGAVPAWPPLWAQAALLFAGAAAGWLLHPVTRRQEAHPHDRQPAKAAAALLCAALLGGGLAGAQAAAPESQRKQRDLKRIQEQIESKRAEAERYQKLQKEAQRDITDILDRKQRSQRRLIELRDRREEALGRAGELSEKLGALRSAHGSGRRLLAEQNRAYALALVWAEPFYGRSELWGQSLRRSGIRARLRLLGGLRSAESRAAAQHEQVRSEARSLSARTSKVAAEVQVHESLYQQKQVAFKDASQKVAQTLQELRELEESARALASFIGDAEKRRSVRRGEAPPIPRHSLPWPAEGKVVSRFGKIHVPKLDTWAIHNGIKIATEEGAPVRAVASGRVIFSGPFRSYGNVLIIDHDAGFYGIYGQLGRMGRGKGERVAPLSEIGAAGASGRGGVLYFEIRRGQEPLDPLGLLEPK